MKLLLLFMAFVCAGSISMAQFSATMKNVVDGQELIYQVYNDGEDDRRTHCLYMEEKRTFTYAWEEGWQLIIEGHEGEALMEVYLE